MTDWGVTPEVTPARKPMRQPTSQVFLEQAGQDAEPVLTDLYEIIASTGGDFFLANEGPSRLNNSFASRGYCLCFQCGRDLTKEVLDRRVNDRQSKTSKPKAPHLKPLSQAVCNGGYTELHLAHQFKSDLVRIRFTRKAKPPSLYGVPKNYQGDTGITSEVSDAEESLLAGSGVRFWRSLTYAMVAAAAQVLDIKASELDGLFRSIESQTNTTEIIIYDNVPSGVGHSKRIAAEFQSILKYTLQLASSCTCSSSCYDCIRTYSNQPFHDQLDRRLVVEFLQRLVEVINPDETLREFAPQSNRISLSRVASLIGSSARMLKSESTFAITGIHESFSIPVLSSLISTSAAKLGKPITLILQSLPERYQSQSTALARRRLSQWIEQGVLSLYVNSSLDRDTYCFSPNSPGARRAFQVNYSPDRKPVEFLETRSEAGIQAVTNRLDQWLADSRPVSSEDIADPENLIVFPSRSWPAMTLDRLRAELGLSELFEGRDVRRIEYSDRYINKRGRHARVLADLLRGPWLSPKAKVIIKTEQAPDEYNSNDNSRRIRLREDLDTLNDVCDTELEWREHRSRGEHKRLPHRREMIIESKEADRVLVLFDKGMDFVDLNDRTGLYKVYDDTYIVATRLSKE